MPEWRQIKTGKTTPEGKPDPSIFSTGHNREGIQVGTAIATLIRKFSHSPAAAVEFRQVWGAAKRQELLDTAEAEPATLYAHVIPPLDLGLPFAGAAVGAGYFGWPKLPELLPVSFPGVKTRRDEFLLSIDREGLEKGSTRISIRLFRIKTCGRDFRPIMAASARFDPIRDAGDTAWSAAIGRQCCPLCLSSLRCAMGLLGAGNKLLDEKRAEYWPHDYAGNRCVESGSTSS